MSERRDEEVTPAAQRERERERKRKGEVSGRMTKGNDRLGRARRMVRSEEAKGGGQP